MSKSGTRITSSDEEVRPMHEERQTVTVHYTYPSLDPPPYSPRNRSDPSKDYSAGSTRTMYETYRDSSSRTSKRPVEELSQVIPLGDILPYNAWAELTHIENSASDSHSIS